MTRCAAPAAFVVALAAAGLAAAQAQHDPAAALAAQREAMKAFAAMDGVWRGTATTTLPSGDKHVVTQTERIGAFLDGSVKIIEGRGYRADGSVGFNALGIVSYDPAKRVYSLRSYALGHAGDFAFTPTADGYEWEIALGAPPASGEAPRIRYVATIRDGTLTEVGDRIVPGRDPVRFFEMTLKRIGDTGWPAADPVPMK
jgi:hypothetical protein